MKIVAYFRVSTDRQGKSGLGLAAQRAAVQEFAAQRGATIIRSFKEIESGGRSLRPKLTQALNLARVTGSVLVIAKLDRLSRNAAFLLALRDSGVRFVAADMPDATNLTVGIMAVVAQDERERISRRTREALAAAKARGQRLGNPNGADALRRAGKGNLAAIAARQAQSRNQANALAPIIHELEAEGFTTLRALANELNERGIQTPGNGATWYPATVARVRAFH